MGVKIPKHEFPGVTSNDEFHNAINTPPLFCEIQKSQGGVFSMKGTVYTMSLRAISKNIAPQSKRFFVEGQPLKLGMSSRPGRRRKKNRGRGTIAGYSTKRRRIYNIYPLHGIKCCTRFIRPKVRGTTFGRYTKVFMVTTEICQNKFD